MSLVTLLWSAIAVATMTLAAVHGLAWLLDRRNLASLMFCCLAIAVAGVASTDIGVMHANTAAEYGRWIRWEHVPAFAYFAAYVLFVRLYLGTGRVWLASTIISLRLLVLVVNFLVYPNFNFQSITSLRQMSFLGERISVIGEATVRSWQWIPQLTVLLTTAFVIDAAIQCWRTGGREAQRKSLVVAYGMALPLSITLIAIQLVTMRLVRIPQPATPGFTVTLLVMSFELARSVAVSRKAQEEVAQLRVDLARAERVNALGQLASALAHEISQPLDAIQLNSEAAEMHLNSENPDLRELRSIVTDIKRDDKRAGAIIDRVRALIKRRKVEFEPFSVGEVLQDVIALVQHETHSAGFSLNYMIDPGLPDLWGDRVQISQVLLNLILNAMEALQDRSKDSRRIDISARTIGDHANIAVSDNGPGIASVHLERIFDPLFSTKADGMGMGLAISRTIVHSHGGSLRAQNRSDGGGATFTFTLRLAPEEKGRVASA